MRPRSASCAIGLLCVAAFGSIAHASPPVAQPPMNIGQTSFLDGEAGQGGLFEVIGDGISANHFTDSNGKRLSGHNAIRSGSITLHPAYVSDVPFAGGHLGIEGLFPAIVTYSNLSGQMEAISGGIGDITISSFVQWSDGNLFGRPFSARLAMQVVAPTGSYAPGNIINFGQNAWQLSPYLAVTWRVLPRWEISGRATYDWSGRNGAPSPAYQAANIQAGDQFAINMSASYAVSDRLRLGLSGYAFSQLRNARINGSPVAGSHQQTFGLGPGVLWTMEKMTVIATAYRELATKNRPEGFQFVLRLLQPF
jgi:hypothetical protein